MELFAYNISGNTNQKVGIDVISWSDKQLNGNNPFLITYDSTIPSGYTNISSIENWDFFGLGYASDYGAVKFAIKNIIDEIGWSGLTSNEKDLAIKYYSYPSDLEAITYLMLTKELTQQQAQSYLLESWHKHHLNFIESCHIRWAYAKYFVLIYLSIADAEDLFNTTRILVEYYVETGRLGILYNDSKSGIMDFIFSVNDYIGQGLEESGYTLLQGTWEEFKKQLEGVFVYGEYTRYG